MDNRKPSHAPILFLAPTLLAVALLLLLPLPAPAADPTGPHSEAASKQQAPAGSPASESVLRARMDSERVARVHASIQSMTSSNAISAELAEQKAALAGSAKEHLAEIIDDLTSRPAVDYHDAQRFCATYLRYRKMGFDLDTGRVTDLAEQLYRDTNKTSFDARILLANFLANDLGRKKFLKDLAKIQNALSTQTLHSERGPNGMLLRDYLAESALRSVQTYDDAVEYLKTHGPSDPFFNPCVVKLRRFRYDAEKAGKWTTEKDRELIVVIESLLEQSTSESQKENLRSWIRATNNRIAGLGRLPR